MMIFHIVVVRKSVLTDMASNVPQYGIAGLNIDGCRVGCQGDNDSLSATPQGKCTSKEIAAIGVEPDSGREFDRVGFDRLELKGRFPTNIILQHSDRCSNDGVKVVGSGVLRLNQQDELLNGVDEGYKRPNASMFTHKPKGQLRQYGKEEVENWDCQSSCPVKAMDCQSGDSCGAFAPVKIGQDGRSRGVYGNFGQKGDDGKSYYGDKGGASRFFKSFQESF